MQNLIVKCKGAIAGVLNGFDRIVFQGFLLPLMYPAGAMSFFDRKRILYKDAARWVEGQTREVIRTVEALCQAECGCGITYIASTRERKEELARRRQEQTKVREGLIGAWSCVEAGSSYRLRPAQGKPQLHPVQTRCKHLYLYLDHPEYGFMSVRFQTWLPYKIQIAMNGREWLARSLDNAGIGYQRYRNKFVSIDDYDQAQQLMDRQLDTRWQMIFDGLVPLVFPTMQDTLGPGLSYTWTCWQSEWATDLIFSNPSVLKHLMQTTVRHAFITGSAGRLLRFFDRAVNREGHPFRNFNGSVQSVIRDSAEGYRIRHWIDRNSVNLYNERNVMRIETTINEPSAFRVHRRKQKAPRSAPKERLPMRKGVADMTLRAQVSQEVNHRYADHLAAAECSVALNELLADVTEGKRARGRRIRGLDLVGKDSAFLSVIMDPRFSVSGFSNKDLRRMLNKATRYAKKTDKQLSGVITRLVRLFRDHGLLRKIPKQNRYHLSPAGRRIAVAVQAALCSDTKRLIEIAA